MSKKQINRVSTKLVSANQQVKSYIDARRLPRRRVYACEFCDKEFALGSALRRHLHYCENVPLSFIALLADASERTSEIRTSVSPGAATRASESHSIESFSDVVSDTSSVRIQNSHLNSRAEFVRCSLCGVAVKKMSRHMRRVHKYDLSSKTPSPSQFAVSRNPQAESQPAARVGGSGDCHREAFFRACCFWSNS